MPSLSDGNFAQTVALVCEHSDRGALGIVLNKPMGMKLGDVMAQMKLEPSDIGIGEQPVLRGGPVHTDRGFVLHRPGGAWDSTHRISDNVQVTTSRDVLAAAFGDTVCGLVFARKYCRPKKTVTRTSIMTRSDLLSPPPC